MKDPTMLHVGRERSHEEGGEVEAKAT